MAKAKSKIKARRVIAIILMVIGGITVIDNAFRLVKEIGYTITHHRYSTVLVQNHN